MLETLKIDTEIRRTLTHRIDLKTVVEKAYDLPVLPTSTVRLAALVASHDYHVNDVVDIISFDPILTLKLIRSANSAFAAASSPITTVRDAAARLGSAQILSLAVASHARPLMKHSIPEYNLDAGQLWRHGIATALVAELLPRHCTAQIPPETFTASLLHDIGKLVMARFLDQETLDWLDRVRSVEGANAAVAEREVLNTHHGELGGIIAQHWKMPEPIVKGIIHHHTPEEEDTIVCHAVCLSNQAAKAVEAKLEGGSFEFDLAKSTLDQIGINSEKLEELCTQCASEFRERTQCYNTR